MVLSTWFSVLKTCSFKGFHWISVAGFTNSHNLEGIQNVGDMELFEEKV